MNELNVYLLLSVLLFSVGLAVVVSRKNAVVVLIGIELIFNAANLNLIAFNRYDPEHFQGIMFSLFVVVVAAAEVSVALAIILNLFRRYGTIHLDKINRLNG